MISFDAGLAGRVPRTTLAPASASRAGGWFGAAFRGLDFLLRRCKGIGEFCTDRRCIIRVALVRAQSAVTLADGTRIAAGDPIGEIHLWNEQLPRIPTRRPDIAWALAVQRGFAHSFAQLAGHVETHPEFAAVAAFRGNITFAGGRQRAGKLARVVGRHGLELVASARPRGRLRRLCDSLFVRCLLCAFNPGGLRVSRFRRQSYELWISKPALLARHRGAAPGAAGNDGAGQGPRRAP